MLENTLTSINSWIFVKQLRRKFAGRNLSPRKYDAPFYDVLQFPDISKPAGD